MTSSPFLTGRLRPASPPSSAPAPGHRIDPIAWTAVAVVVGAVFTVLVLAAPWLPAGYRLGPLSAEINAADGCVALLAAYLAHGRFVRDRDLRFGLIAQGLALFGAASLVMPVAMQLVPAGHAAGAFVWAAAVVRLVASGLIAAGACAGDRRVRSGPPRGLAAAAPPAVLVVVLLLVGAVASLLPPALVPVTEGRPDPLVFTSHPFLAAVQILSAVLLLAAAVLLTRLAVLHPLDVIGMMGPAFVLDGFALFQYALFPTLTTDWIYSGDVLRAGCYALLLVGAVVEIRRYWSGQSRAAVLADRRRLAREIHDGVVQEIAYIRMETRSLPLSDGAERIVDACDRALDEARDAVHALALSEAEPLHHLL
jgi:signal transduction histidine kinase